VKLRLKPRPTCSVDCEKVYIRHSTMRRSVLRSVLFGSCSRWWTAEQLMGSEMQCMRAGHVRPFRPGRLAQPRASCTSDGPTVPRGTRFLSVKCTRATRRAVACRSTNTSGEELALQAFQTSAGWSSAHTHCFSGIEHPRSFQLHHCAAACRQEAEGVREAALAALFQAAVKKDVAVDTVYGAMLALEQRFQQNARRAGVAV
jgi:hypothetical protein